MPMHGDNAILSPTLHTKGSIRGTFYRSWSSGFNQMVAYTGVRKPSWMDRSDTLGFPVCRNRYLITMWSIPTSYYELPVISYFMLASGWKRSSIFAAVSVMGANDVRAMMHSQLFSGWTNRRGVSGALRWGASCEVLLNTDKEVLYSRHRLFCMVLGKSVLLIRWYCADTFPSSPWYQDSYRPTLFPLRLSVFTCVFNTSNF